MKKPSQRNSLIVTIPLAATAAAWVFLLFLPIQKVIGRLQDEIDEMQQYCNRSELLLPVLGRTGRDLAEVRKKVAYWDKTAPSPEDLTPLLGQITAAARAAGLRTTRFDPKPIVVYDRIAEMPVSMGVTGSFPLLFRFLAKIENMPQTVWIDRLEIEKAGQTGWSVSCDMDLAIFMDNPENSDQRNDLPDR